MSASEERNKRLLAEAWDMEQPGATGVAEVAADIRAVVEENQRLREYGDHLAREVHELPWRPGEGHLTDALEAWRSVSGGTSK